MEKTEQNGKSLLRSIAGPLLLIILLFMGIRGTFWLLGQAVGPSVQPPAQSVEQDPEPAPEEPGPSYCPFCGKAMRDGFQWGQFCPFCGEQIE